MILGELQTSETEEMKQYYPRDPKHTGEGKMHRGNELTYQGTQSRRRGKE